MQVRRVFVIAVALGVALLPGAASASTGWVIQPTPNPSGMSGEGSFSKLEAVSCLSATSCTAAGGFFDNSTGTSATLIEYWDGTSWQVRPTPNPPTISGVIDDAELRGVKCVSVSACMAVGEYINSAGVRQTLAESWNGTAWSIVPTPNPAGAAASQLNAVACTTAANCIAAGYYQNSAGTNLPLAARWNGTSWALQPVPATSGGHLLGVSCTSASACTAVGYAGNNGLADRWNGSTWKTQTVPKPSGDKSIQLNGVKCSSSTVCMAAGTGSFPSTSNGFSFTAENTLAEQWSSGTWKVKATPSPNSGASFLQDSLTAISCTSASACTAVGISDSSLGILTAAEVWNGTSWKVQSTPSVSAEDNRLLSVSCTTTAVCTAVGEYDGDGGFSSEFTLAMQRT